MSMRLPVLLCWLATVPVLAQAPRPLARRWLLHEPPAAAAPCTLLCVVPGDQHLLQDESAYLSDLQRRFEGRGLRVVVLLRGPAAAVRPIDQGAAYSLGILDAGEPQPDGTFGDYSPCRLLAADGGELWRGLPAQGVAVAIERALAGKLDAAVAPAAANLRARLLTSIGDGGDFASMIDQLVALAPGDAHALALRYLDQLAHGDVDAARRTVQDALETLAGESLPLACFCDLAMRAERDPGLLPSMTAALTNAAAAAGDSPLLQMILLRALLRSGLDRDAGRLLVRLPKLLAGRPMELLAFAETLADGRSPQPWRVVAERAIQTAGELGADPRWLFAARHKVAVRCAEDDKAAAAIAAEYLKSPAFPGSCNSDAWQLMTRLDTMGRFDPLALAVSTEQQRLNANIADAACMDTQALALFRNGRLDEAIELQQRATALVGNRATYVGRLQRYRRCQELRRKDGKER